MYFICTLYLWNCSGGAISILILFIMILHFNSTLWYWKLFCWYGIFFSFCSYNSAYLYFFILFLSMQHLNIVTVWYCALCLAILRSISHCCKSFIISFVFKRYGYEPIKTSFMSTIQWSLFLSHTIWWCQLRNIFKGLTFSLANT